jgi:hypothetical protein
MIGSRPDISSLLSTNKNPGAKVPGFFISTCAQNFGLLLNTNIQNSQSESSDSYYSKEKSELEFIFRNVISYSASAECSLTNSDIAEQ